MLTPPRIEFGRMTSMWRRRSAGMRCGFAFTHAPARPANSSTRRNRRNARSPEKTRSETEKTVSAIERRVSSARTASCAREAIEEA